MELIVFFSRQRGGGAEAVLLLDGISMRARRWDLQLPMRNRVGSCALYWPAPCIIIPLDTSSNILLVRDLDNWSLCPTCMNFMGWRMRSRFAALLLMTMSSLTATIIIYMPPCQIKKCVLWLLDLCITPSYLPRFSLLIWYTYTTVQCLHRRLWTTSNYL